MEEYGERKKTCCFTGHRRLPQEKYQQIVERTKAEIRRLIVEKDVCFFCVGGAAGYDALAAGILIELRAEFPKIKIFLLYPFDGFTDDWRAEERLAYMQRFPLYDKVVCVCDRPGREAYFARNRGLVDCSAYCIAYCTRRRSGAGYTLRYAEKEGLDINNIAK